MVRFDPELRTQATEGHSQIGQGITITRLWPSAARVRLFFAGEASLPQTAS